MINNYLNKKLLEAELKKHKLMCEYSFYVGEDDDYDKDVNNLILGEEGDEDNKENTGFGDIECEFRQALINPVPSDILEALCHHFEVDHSDPP